MNTHVSGNVVGCVGSSVVSNAVEIDWCNLGRPPTVYGKHWRILLHIMNNRSIALSYCKVSYQSTHEEYPSALSCRDKCSKVLP